MKHIHYLSLFLFLVFSSCENRSSIKACEYSCSQECVRQGIFAGTYEGRVVFREQVIHTRGAEIEIVFDSTYRLTDKIVITHLDSNVYERFHNGKICEFYAHQDTCFSRFNWLGADCTREYSAPYDLIEESRFVYHPGSESIEWSYLYEEVIGAEYYDANGNPYSEYHNRYFDLKADRLE